jgi:hypothetical protein
MDFMLMRMQAPLQKYLWIVAGDSDRLEKGELPGLLARGRFRCRVILLDHISLNDQRKKTDPL